jgi:hypothetical protein
VVSVDKHFSAAMDMQATIKYVVESGIFYAIRAKAIQ